MFSTLRMQPRLWKQGERSTIGGASSSSSVPVASSSSSGPSAAALTREFVSAAAQSLSGGRSVSPMNRTLSQIERRSRPGLLLFLHTHDLYDTHTQGAQLSKKLPLISVSHSTVFFFYVRLLVFRVSNGRLCLCRIEIQSV